MRFSETSRCHHHHHRSSRLSIWNVFPWTAFFLFPCFSFCFGWRALSTLFLRWGRRYGFLATRVLFFVLDFYFSCFSFSISRKGFLNMVAGAMRERVCVPFSHTTEKAAEGRRAALFVGAQKL